jgi:hypothetical protein
MTGRTAAALADTACALEEYRLEHGDWPDDLGRLAGTEGEGFAIDPASGKALKYGRHDAGVFVRSALALEGWTGERDLMERVALRQHQDHVFLLLHPQHRGVAVSNAAAGPGRAEGAQ